jgi:hypothetical protein
MSSVEPLLRGEATDFERRLLSSVRGERPSARQRAHMLKGIGLSSGIALWATTAQAMVTSAAGKAVIGLGAAAIVSFAALPLVREPAALPLDATAFVNAPEASAAAPVEAVADRAEDGVDSVTDDAEPAVVADSASELRAQIELLDAVKHAVNRKDGVEAMALLASFDERFPRGVLQSEARTLRRAAGRLSAGRGR